MSATAIATSLTVQSWKQGDSYRLVLSGEFDLLGEQEMLNQLERLERHHPQSITVDLGDVTFMDTSAINTFVRARTRARVGGWVFGLAAAVGQPLRLLELAGLTTLSLTA